MSYNVIVQPVVDYGLSQRLGSQLHPSLQYSKQPLIRTKRFKNLLAEIWRFNIPKYKPSKIKRVVIFGLQPKYINQGV